MNPDPGLCATCRHVKRLESPRSAFYMCLKAETDPAYKRYPPLPVVKCPGYERRQADGQTTEA